MLYQLTDQVVDVLGVDGAGVSLAQRGDDLSFVTASDARVAGVEEVQIEVRDGPCHDAYRTGEVIEVEDLHADPRWPEYTAAAHDAGVRAVLAVPMPVDEGRIGAVDIYRLGTHRWDPQEVRVAAVLAERNGITPTEAFGLLRERARAGQVRVHDLAARAVDGTDVP